MAPLGEYLLYYERASLRSSNLPPPGGLVADFPSHGDGEKEVLDNQEVSLHAKEFVDNLGRARALIQSSSRFVINAAKTPVLNTENLAKLPCQPQTLSLLELRLIWNQMRNNLATHL